MRSIPSPLVASFVLGCAAALAQPADPPANPLKLPVKLVEQAPETYRVRFEASNGTFVVEVHRDWAPRGADRFYNLVKHGFFDDARFFRVVPGFVVQFGLKGDPGIDAVWKGAAIQDDPVLETNGKGFITFATAGKDTRTTQVFINLAHNQRLDRQGFAPFGKVVEGLDVVERINAKHGQQPDQGRISTEGNAYLTSEFPDLDYVKKATLL